MRRLLAILIALAVLVPTAASAGEGPGSWPAEGGPPIVPNPLAELNRLVEDYIDELQEEPDFGSPGWLTRRMGLIAGGDLFIGSIRASAILFVDSTVPEPLRSVINSLPGDTPIFEVLQAVDAARADPVSAWLGQEIGIELVALRGSLERLRELLDGAGPERVCPVLGPVEFTNDWGDQRPGVRTHKGTDLHAPVRTPVRAIEDGVVVQANWHNAGGRQIYIRADSTGDVYYYAHLDDWEEWIWTGTRVAAGDVIGLLGSSGNADSAHLHFGWIPGSGWIDLENLQNPYPLLLEICPDPAG
ncbi:MAG: M23 family metallopeptidase [Acidimicrobiia bacterium]